MYHLLHQLPPKLLNFIKKIKMSTQLQKQKYIRPNFLFFWVCSDCLKNKTERWILIYSLRNTNALPTQLRKQFCWFIALLHNSSGVRPLQVQSSLSSRNFILIILPVLVLQQAYRLCLLYILPNK